VAGSGVQDIHTGAIGAHDRLPFDMQEHPWMSQRTVAAVAGDGSCVDMDGLGRGRKGGGAVRHRFNLYGRVSEAMIAMRQMLSTIQA
jgi:hypothetical protein